MTIEQRQSTSIDVGTVEYATDAVMDFSMINESIAVGPPLDDEGELQDGWMQHTYEP